MNHMKRIYSLLTLVGLIILLNVGCTKDFNEINTDPNRPTVVPTTNLIVTAERSLLDDIRDEWFSGRGGLLYAQYWAQRNYTSEDRYALRDGTNNNYWRLIYTDIMSLEEIIKLNTDESTKALMSKYGNNANQIAAATGLKLWAVQLLTDTYGDIPYSEAFNAEENPSPKYDAQKDIYKDMLVKLKAAAEMINEDEAAFTAGDIIYGGDASLWKKFINSLRLRVALRLSKVTDSEIVALRDATIAELKSGVGVFQSNDDNAAVKYLGDNQSNAPLNDAFVTSARNDFTVTKQFVDLLKGENDVINNKTNPFLGLVDPRMYLWVPKSNAGTYNGIPYGISDVDAAGIWSTIPRPVANLRPSLTVYNMVINGDASLYYMEYAEVCFMLSEVNNWDQSWYVKGVEASMQRWGVEQADIDAYVATLPAANAENVLTQKYIAHYMDGFEAWADWRRTGFPKNLVQPGELTGPLKDGSYKPFTPIIGTAIPRRVTYPVQEFTINKTNVEAAKARMTGNELSTKVWWDGGQ